MLDIAAGVVLGLIVLANLDRIFNLIGILLGTDALATIVALALTHWERALAAALLAAVFTMLFALFDRAKRPAMLADAYQEHDAPAATPDLSPQEQQRQLRAWEDYDRRRR